MPSNYHLWLLKERERIEKDIGRMFLVTGFTLREIRFCFMRLGFLKEQIESNQGNGY